MANSIQIPSAGGSVTVDAAGALTGDGTVATPLAVAVDGVTVTIVADKLTATGTGTIGGSTGATDNAILRADGTGGSTLQASSATISDAGDIVATSFSNGNAAPGTPSNNQLWVICTGTSPSRVCSFVVQDGGSARTLASITY